MRVDINIIPPSSCDCGFAPVKLNNNGQAVNPENLWVTVPIPNSVVWFFICPKCSKVHPNKNFLDNTKALKEAKERKILTPTEMRLAKING